MAEEKKQPTKEEIEAKKSADRAAALGTFKGNLVNLATAFYVEKSNQYGEAGASAIDQYIYGPALKSKEGVDLLYGNLLGSRQNGRRYSGSTSEWALIQTAARIVQESFGAITVEDIYGLMGSKVKVAEEFQGKYLGDLSGSKDKETKELADALTGAYVANLMDRKVSEALGMRAKDRLGNLEQLVKEEEPKK
jgi:hypothetical protein